MEVAECPEVAPLPFPDLSLTVSYSEALSYAQGRLKMLGSGGLKPFCETHQLTYTNVINLKNGKLKREEPRLVQRLLGTLAVPTELLHYPLGSKTPCFLLPDAEALATFQSQLQFLTAAE
ncbi:hypothetical protein [Hymenobacter glacieicola]|uniref:HTH cro/C1-type domain-containing protein n=1 Tax=Hymenobacter glacieicola TaxID=1562124 RepID=A0ABQ1X4F0_9BACT|nr:hypothetical protein [Hymenobacter glacieicola]GGG59453.1 hypothetical protein GCM10011378_39290 [Hymenobacter glacieicola]